MSEFESVQKSHSSAVLWHKNSSGSIFPAAVFVYLLISRLYSPGVTPTTFLNFLIKTALFA